VVGWSNSLQEVQILTLLEAQWALIPLMPCPLPTARPTKHTLGQKMNSKKKNQANQLPILTRVSPCRLSGTPCVPCPKRTPDVVAWVLDLWGQSVPGLEVCVLCLPSPCLHPAPWPTHNPYPNLLGIARRQGVSFLVHLSGQRMVGRVGVQFEKQMHALRQFCLRSGGRFWRQPSKNIK